MLTYLSKEKIQHICNVAAERLAAEESQQSDTVDITSKEAGDLVDEILDGEKDALLEALESLTRNELTELLALMWLGRGDFGHDPSDFAQALEKASHMHNKDEIACYISDKNKLDQYLKNGLQYLGES